jgi:hypothetical protein
MNTMVKLKEVNKKHYTSHALLDLPPLCHNNKTWSLKLEQLSGYYTSKYPKN